MQVCLIEHGCGWPASKRDHAAANLEINAVMSVFRCDLDRRQKMAAVTGLVLSSTLGAQPAKTDRFVVMGGAEDCLKNRVILRKFVDDCASSAAAAVMSCHGITLQRATMNNQKRFSEGK